MSDMPPQRGCDPQVENLTGTDDIMCIKRLGQLLDTQAAYILPTDKGYVTRPEHFQVFLTLLQNSGTLKQVIGEMFEIWLHSLSTDKVY